MRKISPGVVDYYLRDDDGRRSGYWRGHGSTALGLTGEVQRHDLASVLQGRHPGTDDYLPRARPVRRRAGWDLMFSAPKTVSLLAAIDPANTESVRVAHSAAVADVMDHLEARLLTVERAGAPSGKEPAQGAVSAHFLHDVNAAGEPHTHTHVLLANLGQGSDGDWSAVGKGHWKVWRTGLFSLYSLGLRHHLGLQGWDLDWRLRPDGLVDIAGVPRAAVRSVSTQSAATASMGWYEARRRAVVGPWRSRMPATTMELPVPTHGPPDGRKDRSLAPERFPALAESVAQRLLERKSRFRDADVLVALGGCHPGGARAPEALDWVRHFCSTAVPVDSSGSTPRWTTMAARRADQRLVEMGGEVDRTEPAHGRLGLVGPGRPAEILGTPAGTSGLFSHAATLQGGVAAWKQEGLEVAVNCRRERDVARWQALTGIPPARLRRPPDVLVVDQADRRATPELLSILDGASRRGSSVIMIEGGTMPRLTEPASLGLVGLGDRLGRVPPTAHGQHRAIEELTGHWSALGQSRVGALLVGLGPEEAAALNLAARESLLAAGQLDPEGPTLAVGPNHYQRGDRVMLLRLDGTDRRRGSLGTVRGLDAGRAVLQIEWDDRTSQVYQRGQARALGYGYATTPDMARRHQDAPVLLLGGKEAVPALAGRVLASSSAPSIETGRELVLDRRESVGGLGL